jgi:flagellar protein FlbD
MIHVTRLDRRQIIVNADLIKYVESTPDTIMTLTTGEKITVLESPDEVVKRVIDYGRQLRVFPGSA